LIAERQIKLHASRFQIMRYQVVIPDAMKAQLRAMPESVRQEIGYKLFLLQEDLSGDIKKLKGSKKQYRLRVGDYRVLSGTF
jgi:mRNA-degrading endonuclease RelE of RelBE toxin-antitoxin system